MNEQKLEEKIAGMNLLVLYHFNLTHDDPKNSMIDYEASNLYYYVDDDTRKKIIFKEKNSENFLEIELDLDFNPSKDEDAPIIKIKLRNKRLTLIFSNKKDQNIFNEWLSKKEKKEANAIRDKLIEDSFTIGLAINPETKIDPKQFLKNQINNMINAYDSQSYYGPFTTICQSSGFGKSRTCASLKDDFYVVYCCLREKFSTGYPKRSCLADDLLNDPEYVEKYYICYFGAFIHFLNHNKITCTDFYEKYDQQIHNGNNILVRTMVDQYLKESKQFSNIPEYENRKTPLVFVFDESSALLKPKSNSEKLNYFIMRSILYLLKGKVFVLFLDTITNLKEFMPTQYFDPSSRIAKGVKLLFEPLFLLPSWDAFANYNCIRTIKETIKFETICSFGRVLWGSWVRTRNEKRNFFAKITYSELYDLAISKLIGGRSHIDYEFTSNDCIAILSCRVGVIKQKVVYVNQQLVAYNMAICTYVNSKKMLFEIDYPSEPLLAEAAAYLMNNVKSYTFFVDKLIEQVETSLISKGEKGEIIAKLIILNARDKISLNKNNSYKKIEQDADLKFLNLISVGDFLLSLFGACGSNCGSKSNKWTCKNKKRNKICCLTMINDQLENSDTFLNGIINFNHFTKSDCWLKDVCLETALKRCAAVDCKEMQIGTDLVIPVSLKEFELLTGILIQVKLHQKPVNTDFDKIFEKVDLNPFKNQKFDVPYLMIYMQLGGSNDIEYRIENIKTGKKDNRALIYSKGISKKNFIELEDNLDKKLQSFGLSKKKKFGSDQEMEQIYQVTRYCLK